MKILKQGMLFAMALMAFLGSKAQTVDEIINKHFDAIGGKDQIDKVKSLHTEATVQVMGNDAPSTITVLNGKGMRLESEFNGQKMVQVFTDKGGWAINPMAGSPDPQAMPDEQYKAGKDQIDVGGPLYNYAAKGSKVELLGKEDSAYKLKVTSSDGVVTNIFIDPSTYLIKKTVQTGSMMGQEMEITRTYSNFQKTDFGLL
ncbi:MAG TPA: hypothetical protein VFV08_14650, partial [Puia sp.]|nr:hypothetical protein [Puia sp.]